MRTAATDQVVERGEHGLHGLDRHTRARGDLLPGRGLDALGVVQREGARDDPLAGGIDIAARMTGLVAGRSLEAAADRREPEGGAVGRRGLGHLLERAPPARAQLPEDVAAHFAPSHEPAVQQPPTGAADLGLVGLEQPAQLLAAELGRAVEHGQKLVGLRAPGHARRRRHAFEPPVSEGDRGVEPAEHLRSLAGAGPRVAQGIERRAERLGVGLEHGVHQPQSNGVEAARFGLQPRDAADERTRAGIPALL